MGLVALSLLLSLALGGCVWLVAGDRLPLGGAEKWPASSNILCYGAALLVPVYLTIFFIYEGGGG